MLTDNFILPVCESSRAFIFVISHCKQDIKFMIYTVTQKTHYIDFHPSAQVQSDNEPNLVFVIAPYYAHNIPTPEVEAHMPQRHLQIPQVRRVEGNSRGRGELGNSTALPSICRASHDHDTIADIDDTARAEDVEPQLRYVDGRHQSLHVDSPDFFDCESAGGRIRICSLTLSA